MKKTFFIFTAFMAVFVNAQYYKEEKHYIDYRLASNQGSVFKSLLGPRNVVCTSQGKICDPDCKRIWTCVNHNGELKPALVDTCKEEETCNNGSCSATPTPECALGPGFDFVCQAEGVFPDPRTCKKYHYCIKKEENGGVSSEESGGSSGTTTQFSVGTFADEFDDHERDCVLNRGYNPRTTYCDKVLGNDQCGAEYPVPICKTPGQHAALKDNPSIFYVCSLYNNAGEVLYPYLYLCKDGLIYDGNYGCKSAK